MKREGDRGGEEKAPEQREDSVKEGERRETKMSESYRGETWGSPAPWLESSGRESGMADECYKRYHFAFF